MIILSTRSKTIVAKQSTYFVAIQIVVRRRHSHVSFWMCGVWTKSSKQTEL